MYKRILLPTDGSAASLRAIAAGVDFARDLAAEVVGLTVTKPFRIFSTDVDMLQDSADQYAANVAVQARQLLQPVEAAARAAGVACQLEQLESEHPWQGIIASAERHGCDLVIMASHGQRGIAGLLLGSETQKVLLHSAIPVLVHR
jgi:nucleotide-binding universal stress UspA family protein